MRTRHSERHGGDPRSLHPCEWPLEPCRSHTHTRTRRSAPRGARPPAAPPPAADAPRALGAQVMEEKLDINNVEVAAVKLPPAPPGLGEPVAAACH